LKDMVKRLALAISEEFEEHEVSQIDQDMLDEAQDMIIAGIAKRKGRDGSIGYAKNVFNKAVIGDTLQSLALMFTEDGPKGSPKQYKCIFKPEDDDWDNILELFRAARKSIRGFKWVIVKSYEDLGGE